ncbi:MAG: ribonuclease H family protein, partial [Chloroflexi bacterium]|nr:ribonuclease H family protein [Chloroflexota bacterium]
VVWKGRRTGVFTSWDECSAQVSAYAGAEYKSFDSLSTADSAFRAVYADYKGKSASAGQWKMSLTRPQTPSISVDAACAGVPGPVEWCGVETDGLKPIFKSALYPDGTNNVGEFLAIVQGLAWLMEKQLNWPLYSDSENAILWVKAKKCRTKMARTAKNAALFDLISRAETWLAENQSPNKVLKWDTEMWGENPADFGRK